MSGPNAEEVNAELEVRKLVDRLGRYPAAYVARPEGRLAALVLRLKGYVTTEDGRGHDEGLLIVRRTSRFSELAGGRAATLRPRGGGDAA